MKQKAILYEMKLYAKALGKKIARIRNLKGISRKYLANRIGVCEEYIKTLEEHPEVANPSLILVYKIAGVFKVPPSILIDPKITEENLLDLESIRELSEFAYEHGISDREYEELLILATYIHRRDNGILDKKYWSYLYRLIKGGWGNGQKTLEEFFS
jgi:transcriptional regulator with XRE-family HTH domain